MDGQLLPILPPPHNLYHNQDGARPFTTSTTKASIIIPEYCLFSGRDRQSASLIDIQWDAQNLGEMARFYELVLRTSTQEAGDAYEAVLQQALTQKRGLSGDDQELQHAPIFSRMLVDSDYVQPTQTKGGSQGSDRRSLAELGCNMSTTICVDTAETHPVVWLGAPSTHVIHLPTVNGQLWKYAWLVCAKALVAATADSNSIVSNVPLLQDQLFRACSLAGRMDAAGLHDAGMALLQAESDKLKQSSSSTVHCSSTPQPAPQTKSTGSPGTTVAHGQAGPVLGSVAEIASGQSVIQPNSNANANAPLAPTVYLRLCTLFNLPQLRTLSLQPPSTSPQGAAQQTCQAVAALLVLSVESLGKVSVLWKAWQDTHKPNYLLSCLADLAKSTHYLVEATRVPGALQPVIPGPSSHWPHAAAVGCQKMLMAGLQLLMEVGLPAFYETFLSCSPLSVSRFKPDLMGACADLSNIGTGLQVLLQAASQGVDYVGEHAASVELTWHEPSNGATCGSSAAAAVQGAQQPTHFTRQLAEGAAAYIQGLHSQAVQTAGVTFSSSQAQPSPADPSPPQQVSSSTAPRGPVDPSSPGMLNGQHTQSSEQQVGEKEGTPGPQAVPQPGPSPVSSARRKEAQGRGGAAAALQALAWRRQHSRQLLAIQRILQEHQVNNAQHESFAPTLQEFALRQVRTACSKFGQLLLSWHAGVNSRQDMLAFLVQWGVACGLLRAAVDAVQQSMACAPGPASGTSDGDIVTACLHAWHGIGCMEVCSTAVLGGVAEALEVMQQQAASSYEIAESCSGFKSIMVTRAHFLQAGCAMCSYAVGKCMSLLPEVTAGLPPQSSRAGGTASRPSTAASPAALGTNNTEYAVHKGSVASNGATGLTRSTGALRCAGNPLDLDPKSWSVLVSESVKWLGVLRAKVATQQQAERDSSDRSCRADTSSDAQRLVSRSQHAAAASQEDRDAALEADWLAWANGA